MFRHLDENDESYFRHLVFALRAGTALVGAGIAALLHGLLPCCFTTTASRTVRRLHGRFAKRNRSF